MTLKEFYRTGIFKVDHRTFGGRIYAYDFETEFAGNNKEESNIAKRIFTDWKFDEQCRKNLANRKYVRSDNNA